MSPPESRRGVPELSGPSHSALAELMMGRRDPASKRAHLILERQARHMTRLINDTLDMTRVRHGKLRLTRDVFDVRQCAERPRLDPPSGSSPPPITEPPRRHRVLVDDEVDVAEVFAALLETLGQEFITANDGTTAIAMAREQRPQVAFVDVSMPEMGGAAVAAQLREQLSSLELLSVAVTGYGQSHAAVKAALSIGIS